MIRIREFDTRQETEDFINDVLRGAIPLSPKVPVNLDGLTLTFTTPAVTVTFSGTALRPNDVVAQINAATAATTATIRRHAGVDANFVTLIDDGDVLTGGTAATALGLSAGTVGANKIVLAKLHSVGTKGASGDTFFIVYEE